MQKLCFYRDLSNVYVYVIDLELLLFSQVPDEKLYTYMFVLGRKKNFEKDIHLLNSVKSSLFQNEVNRK